MENMTKMLLCIMGLFILGIVYQLTYGNRGSILVGGIVIFGLGFGWYASKTKEDELAKKRER